MPWLILLCILTAVASADPAPETEDTANEVEDCKDSVTELKNRMLGLQFFLQDKKDYEEYCSKTEWTQPKLEEYKEDPKPHLPEGCKPEED